MNMKWFALLGLLLFLGVAVAPIINANISKEFDSNISSPLFNKRITNAIESVDTVLFNCSFIGENSEIDISFSSNREFSRYIANIYRIADEVDVNKKDISEFISKLHFWLLENNDVDFVDRLEVEIDTFNATIYKEVLPTVYYGSCFTFMLPELCMALFLIIFIELFIFLMLIIFFPTIILLELIREFIRFGPPSTIIQCP